MPIKIPKNLSHITVVRKDGTYERIRVRFLAVGGNGVVYLDVSSKPQRLFKLFDGERAEKEANYSQRQPSPGVQKETTGAHLLFRSAPATPDREVVVEHICLLKDKSIICDAYTMPFIPSNGVTIDRRTSNMDFADPALQDLPFFQRLALFDSLAAQIEFLHENDAIMTDFKPSNLIFSGVTARPTLRLIDAGAVVSLATLAQTVQDRRVNIGNLGPKDDRLRPPPAEPIKIKGHLGEKNKSAYLVAKKEWDDWFSAWQIRHPECQPQSFTEVVKYYRIEAGEDVVARLSGFAEAEEIIGIQAADDCDMSPETSTPELCRVDENLHSVCKNSDVYLLGRMLFTLLGGDISETIQNTALYKRAQIRAQMEEPVDRLFKAKFPHPLSETKKQLKELLLSCFEADPKNRPSTIELRAALKEMMRPEATAQEMMSKTDDEFPLVEKTDWLITQLANRGPTEDILLALDKSHIQEAIIKSPSSFYQFFKTIHHLRAEQPDNALLNNDIIETILTRGAAVKENHYGILKALCLLKGMEVDVAYPLESLGVVDSDFIRVLQEFSGCETLCVTLINSGFIDLFFSNQKVTDLLTFQGNADCFCKVLEGASIPKTVIECIKERHDDVFVEKYVDKITIDNLTAFLEGARQELLSRPCIASRVKDLLVIGSIDSFIMNEFSKVTNPISFLQKAQQLLTKLQLLKVDEQILSAIKTNLDQRFESQCIKNIKLGSLSEFLELATSEILNNPSVGTKIKNLFKAPNAIQSYVKQSLTDITDPSLFIKKVMEQLERLKVVGLTEDKLSAIQELFCQKCAEIINNDNLDSLLNNKNQLFLQNPRVVAKVAEVFIARFANDLATHEKSPIKFAELAEKQITSVPDSLAKALQGSIKQALIKQFVAEYLNDLNSDNLAEFFEVASPWLLKTPEVQQKINQLLDEEALQKFVTNGLKHITDPCNFAKAAKQQIEKLILIGVAPNILEKAKLTQAIVCEKQCLLEINVNNIVDFVTKIDPAHVAVRLILHRKLVYPGNETFIDQLKKSPDILKQLFAIKDLKLKRTMLLTKDPELRKALLEHLISSQDESQITDLKLLLQDIQLGPKLKDIIIQNPKLMVSCKLLLKDNFKELFKDQACFQAAKALFTQARLPSHFASQPRRAGEVIEAVDIGQARVAMDKAGVTEEQFKNALENIQQTTSWGREHITTVAYFIAAFILRDGIMPQLTIDTLAQIENQSSLFSSPIISVSS
jgi:serine/threonine protein kinase